MIHTRVRPAESSIIFEPLFRDWRLGRYYLIHLAYKTPSDAGACSTTIELHVKFAFESDNRDCTCIRADLRIEKDGEVERNPLLDKRCRSDEKYTKRVFTELNHKSSRHNNWAAIFTANSPIN